MVAEELDLGIACKRNNSPNPFSLLVFLAKRLLRCAAIFGDNLSSPGDETNSATARVFVVVVDCCEIIVYLSCSLPRNAYLRRFLLPCDRTNLRTHVADSHCPPLLSLCYVHVCVCSSSSRTSGVVEAMRDVGAIAALLEEALNSDSSLVNVAIVVFDKATSNLLVDTNRHDSRVVYQHIAFDAHTHTHAAPPADRPAGLICDREQRAIVLPRMWGSEFDQAALYQAACSTCVRRPAG